MDNKINREGYIIQSLKKDISELLEKVASYEFEILALREKIESLEKTEEETAE